MNHHTPSTESPTARPKRRFRKWIWLAALAPVGLGLIGIATPAGQRLAVEHTLNVVKTQWPDELAHSDIALERVGVSLRPLGLALHGLSWGPRSDQDPRWAQLDRLVVQPSDASGLHWRQVTLDGLHIDAELWHSLQTISTSSTPDSTPWNGSIATLECRNVTLAFPEAPSARNPLQYAEVKSLFIKDLEISNDGLEFSDGDLNLLTEFQVPSGPEIVADWTFRGHPHHIDWRATPQWSVGPTMDAQWTDWIAWWPNALLGTVDLEARTGQVRIEGAWGAAEARLGIQADTLVLQEASCDIPELPEGLTPFSGAHLFLSSSGPLGLTLEDINGDSPWQRTVGDLNLEAAIRRHEQSLLRLAGQWTPATGLLQVDAHLDEHAMAESLGHSLHLQGLGQMTLATETNTFGLDASGRWSLASDSITPALRNANGAWELAWNQTGEGTEVSFDLDGSVRPLALTPELELFGDLRVRGRAEQNAMGAWDRWSGQVDLLNSRWIPKAGFGSRARNAAPLSMRRFTVFAQGDPTQFDSRIEGDFLRGDIQGPLDVDDWTGPVFNALASAGWWAGAPKPDAAPWEIQLEFLRDDLLERWSSGKQSVGDGSRLAGRWNGRNLDLDLVLTAAHAGPWRSGPLHLHLRQGLTPLTLRLDAEHLRHPEYGRLDALGASAQSDVAGISTGEVHWSGPFSGHWDLSHRREPSGDHRLDWSSGSMEVLGRGWTLDTTGTPRVTWNDLDWTSVSIEDWRWSGELGSLAVGRPEAINDSDANFELRMDGWPISAWSRWCGPLLDLPLPELEGQLNGAVAVDLAAPSLRGSVQWQDAIASDYVLGDLCAEGQWLDGELTGEFLQFGPLGPQCILTLDAEQHIEARFDHWPLSTLDPLLARGGVHIDGTLDGALHVDASQAVPVPQGQLILEAPTVEVDATGGSLGVTGILTLTPDYIGLDHARVTDGLGGIAHLNLSVLHEEYAGWNYDLDLDFSEGPFRLMDLSPAPQRLFHGTVLATGGLNLFGDGHGVVIESDLRSAAGTAFVLPLDALDDVDLPAGIRFVGQAETEAPAPDRPTFGVTLDLDVEVTPEAEVAIVLDSRSGERVDGRATGLVEIGMSPESPLTMEGGVDIVEGAYRFSLRDLFTKRIRIAPGGRIDWDGDPYAAELDLTALSQHRANPLPLLPGMVDRGQTEVELAMDIRGELATPELGFRIRFPEYEQSDASLLAQVQSALAAPEEMERQSFALLATGQFIPAGGSAHLVTQTATAQASELLSSRVSELLSNLSDDVEIGVRYVPANADGTLTGPGGTEDPTSFRTEDAFELDLGLDLLNDRLRIAGTVGAQGMDGFSLDGSQFRGGVDVRYTLTPDGRWEIQGYALPESPLDETPRQGIGAAYQLRFDRFRDLFRGGGMP